MEKKPTGALHRLYLILFFFIISIICLNNKKEQRNIPSLRDSFDIEEQISQELSINQAYQHLESLFISHNVTLIIQVINQCMNQFTVEIVEKICADNTNPLFPEEKMTIIFATAAHLMGKKKLYFQLFDLLLKYPQLHKQIPALLVLMQSKYTEILPLFIVWAKEVQKNTVHPLLLSNFIDHAFSGAVKINDYALMEQMFSKKLRLSEDKSTSLLWYVIQHNKSPLFIPILIKYGQADINNTKNGKTLLITAIEHENNDAIKLLLDHGAFVNKTVDDSAYNPLAVAAKKNNPTILSLLYEYGT